MSRSVGTTTNQHPPVWGSSRPGSRPDLGDDVRPDRGLARSGDAEIVAAWEHRRDLVQAAVTVVVACGHDPDLAACAAAGCHLGALPDGAEVCAVAHALAGLPDAPAPSSRPSAAEAVAEFRSRLIGAADAIRHCRQTEHGTGICWFSAAHDADGCRAVLHLLHAAS